jgi:hypothetical protein
MATLRQTGAMVFTRHDDGRITANGFPDEVEITDEFLASADPSLVNRDGDRLWIAVANGRACYLLVEYSLACRAWRAARLYLTRQ